MADVVTMPKLGFDMAEGTLVRWVVQEGEPIAKGAILAEIETDKATVEVESGFEGIVARHLVPEGEIVPVNTPIAVIAAPGEKLDDQVVLGEDAKPAATPPVEKVEVSPTALATSEQFSKEESELPGGVKASPLARRMAEERGINLSLVRGSGPGGRIVKRDIETYVPAAVSKEAPPQLKSAPALVEMPGAPVYESQSVPLNRLRMAIGRRMTEAKQQVPHFYITHEYDMAALLSLRQEVNRFLPDDEKTSVNDYILKAVSLALREYPNLNASLMGDQVVRHGQVNVGVAVAVEGGLLTVVCRDTDRKSVRAISADVRSKVARAREGKVKPEDIEGSTFSVSNLGMFEVEHFIAIINPPEAAILAVGSVKDVPVVANGQIVPGKRMKATISVDHRVSDGAEAAQFLQALKKYLEEPLRLMV
jgi:pyruvate dehydrogenase E2 component (dihydrolipoamide acetyltransferase)